MTEKEALAKIADAVAYIADRCWEQIGTKDVQTIYKSMSKVKAAMKKKKK
jgi:hypothetical protein